MQFPKLTQLQSRFAACLGASLTVVAIYLLFWSPRFADAAEIGFAGDGWRTGQEGLWQRDSDAGDTELDKSGLEPSPRSPDAGDIVEDCARVGTEMEDGAIALSTRVHERATPSPVATALPGNNIPANLNIAAGESQSWAIQNASAWTAAKPPPIGLPSAFGGANVSSVYLQANGLTTVYVSINTCLQPQWNGSGVQSASPPQLTLSVSTSGADQTIVLNKGFANLTVNASRTVSIAVTAPSLSKDFSGGWNYQLAASVDNYYHGADTDDTPPLYWVDSDTKSALLVTANLTDADPGDPEYDQWLNLSTPFIVFGQNVEDSNTIDGLRNSFCGLQSAPLKFVANQEDASGGIGNVEMGMISRSTKPQQQFYVSALNGSSSYEAILAMPGNSTAKGSGVVGGGGRVWQSRQLNTKSGREDRHGVGRYTFLRTD